MSDANMPKKENVAGGVLHLEKMIGFGGQIANGLKMHPGDEHYIYSIGSTLVIENIYSKVQEFLSGHQNNISCLAVSTNGQFVASGQITYPGFKADIIVWNFAERSVHCKFVLHRNGVESLAFSPTSKFLVSLGGPDDNSVVVWNIESKEAICGSPAQALSSGLTRTIVFSSTSDDVFITAGKETLRVWNVSVLERKMRPIDIKTGQIKRNITNVQVSSDDSIFYCGTTSGDILSVNMNTLTLQDIGPKKEKFSGGVTAIALLASRQLLIGAGDGSVALIKSTQNALSISKYTKLRGAVTSLSVRKNQCFVATSQCSIYCLSLNDLSGRLLSTCHFGSVNDIAFPTGCAELLATCSTEDIRIWNTKTNDELVRITVANMICNALAISGDGKTLVSGWNDGRIRAYYPESGRRMYIMDNAYGSSVTALTTTFDCTKVISGSNLGHLVVWDISGGASGIRNSNATSEPVHISEHFMLKEHKAEVTCIAVRRADTECITSSVDGSCIIWDLIGRCRLQMMRLNTLFKYVLYHPLEHQVLTTGTDRKIGYWETVDASMIREVDGSLSGSVNSLDISEDGSYFASGGDDKIVKLWLYDEGEITYFGFGHSSPITRVKIAPNNAFIISASEDGAILRWAFP